MSAYSIFALTTRGLEEVSARELGELAQVRVEQVAYRRIMAHCNGSLVPLFMLRTVDDVFLDLGHWLGIGRPRSVLAVLREEAAQLNLYAAAALCAELRPVRQQPRFSVTANFVGKRNYSSEEIKFALAEGIETTHGWEYCDDDRMADLNIRIFIEHEAAFVGMRLAKQALHERNYKGLHQPGSLKPPVAAAMLRLSQFHSGQRLLDPFCGAGTILIEAALMGALAAGGDSDPMAISAAQTNASAAAVDISLEHWDARSLPLNDSSVDCVVSNLPWGRQIAVDSTLHQLYEAACAEMERVLRPDGCVVLLTSLPELIRFPSLECQQQIEISLFGQTATIVVSRLMKIDIQNR